MIIKYFRCFELFKFYIKRFAFNNFENTNGIRVIVKLKTSEITFSSSKTSESFRAGPQRQPIYRFFFSLFPLFQATTQKFNRFQIFWPHRSSPVPALFWIILLSANDIYWLVNDNFFSRVNRKLFWVEKLIFSTWEKLLLTEK